MQPVNRLVRHFTNDRTEVVTKAGKDMRWLRWLAESKLLRDHFIDGLPLEMFHAELRVSMRAQAVSPPLTSEETRFVFGP